MLLALLEDCQGWSKLLEVPHTGAQKDRFTAALCSRNLRFCMYGQPELRHYCNKCMRVFKNGTKVWVVVIDGVTVGCPCGHTGGGPRYGGGSKLRCDTVTLLHVTL